MTDDKTHAPLSDARLDAIRAMKFTTGLNAATGHFDTDVERDLYRLAAENYNARLELVREVDRLRNGPARAEHFREAAQLLEDIGHDDDAVNLLRNVADGIAPTPSVVVVEMTREDARELGLILDMDRQRMDKGDDRPVPQPRWDANVRISKAVDLARAATPEPPPARCPACGHQICKGAGPCGAILRLSAVADTERCQCQGVDR